MGRSRFNVRTIWHIGTVDMVGIFMGYYGAGHLFCNIRYCNGCLCLLLFDKTGKLSYTSHLSPSIAITIISIQIHLYYISKPIPTNWIRNCPRFLCKFLLVPVFLKGSSKTKKKIKTTKTTPKEKSIILIYIYTYKLHLFKTHFMFTILYSFLYLSFFFIFFFETF